MSTAVAIVDYGAGNLLSVERALRHLGVQPILVATADAVGAAQRLILPGVGAFGSCMAELSRRNLVDAVHRFAASKRPFLGICVGMQMLFDGSDEFGAHLGLGLLPGWVRPIPSLDADGRRRKVPHVGWNTLRPTGDPMSWGGGILADFASNESVYFVHSFNAEPAEPGDRLAECEYEGIRITAAVHRGNIFGSQFHPEKSGPVGLRILRNFLAL